MRNNIIKIFPLIIVFACGAYVSVLAQDDSKIKPPQSDAAKVYTAIETAVKAKDFKTAWDGCCASFKEGHWGNNYESFVADTLKRTDVNLELRGRVDKEVAVSDKEYHLSVGSGQTFVMSNENGKWCLKGNLYDLSKGNFNDAKVSPK